jgi:hypothetical protein
MQEAALKKQQPPPMINGISIAESDMVSDLELGAGLIDDEDEDVPSTVSPVPGGTLKQQAMNVEKTTKTIRLLAFLVVLMGAAAGASFLYVGITSVDNENKEQFERHASDLANEIGVAWRDYETAALWIHHSCREWRVENTHCSREGFELLSHYLQHGGLEFLGAHWVPNVTHAERLELEANSTWYTKKVNYTGFQGQEPDPDNPGKLKYGPRSAQPFYFPLLVSVCTREMRKNISFAWLCLVMS